MSDLNSKHQRFVDEYLIDLNGAAAAERAGFSARRAKQTAHELLQREDVKAAIAARQASLADKLGVTAERVLAELAKIAFADIRKAVRWGRSPIDKLAENANPNGLGIYPVELVPSTEIEDDIAAAVSEVSLTQTGVRIKMHDKKSALVDLGKHLGLFSERIEHSGPGGKPIQIQGVHDLSDDELAAIAGAGRSRTAPPAESATKPDRVLKRGGNTGQAG